MKMAALEVSPHALTHALNFEAAAWWLCMKTVKASQEYCLGTKAIPQEEEKIDHPIEWRERKREKKGVGGKDWELSVTLATKVGVRIVPRVLVILEYIKAGWLETEKRNTEIKGHLRCTYIALDSTFMVPHGSAFQRFWINTHSHTNGCNSTT